MALPLNMRDRASQITTDFLRLYTSHIEDLVSGRRQGRMTVKEFAAALELRPSLLSETVKYTTGQSVAEFMELGVLLESQRLLEQTDLSISCIARLFAYQESYFNKFFKGQTGLTPLQYRKHHRLTNRTGSACSLQTEALNLGQSTGGPA